MFTSHHCNIINCVSNIHIELLRETKGERTVSTFKKEMDWTHSEEKQHVLHQMIAKMELPKVNLIQRGIQPKHMHGGNKNSRA